MTYHNRRNGYNFAVKVKSRLVESRIGDNAITFAPEGIPSSDVPTEATPIFTVRCGDPSSDKDCEPTLADWLVRLRRESSREEVRISDLNQSEIRGRPCVAFSQQEAQDVGRGTTEEHRARIVVFVENGKTYMLRWEAPITVWEKYISGFETILESFSLGNR